ncbi:TPR end-of-group domain-containing protein [Flavobacterium phycosphaerae]|uniref:TPR end-of-group domain-containing protein n=1 Tax=Flavobacterium phycosphaerae TaxID=2697515 RepID=UPI001389A097|nr:hypothetical protein [Flavobacterium phycosphaerae]
MKQLTIYLVGFLLLMGSNSKAQSQRELYNNSIKAYEAKDYATYLKLTQKLDSLRPYHPTYTYNLASAYALNGNNDKWLAVLKQVLLMNSGTEFEQDSDFNGLKDSPGYDKLIQLKARQNATIATSQKVVSLTEKDLHPEGLTYLPKSKTWLVTSIRKRKIATFNLKTGQCSDWLTDAGMLAVFAAKADSKEQYLWVATTALPEMERYTKEQSGMAEILKVDIKTKQIVKRFPMQGNHVFGDLVVTQNNTVYVSDSGTAMIYKIENDMLSEWLSLENEGYNLQGITLNHDESKMFVADYLKGILMVSVSDKNKTWLGFPEDTSAKGIDGMVFYANSLVVIQNGVKPIRVVQFQLNKAQNAIESYKVVDNNRSEFNEPAQAILVGDSLYFFANSPWNAYDKNGNLELTKFENPKLFTCKLKG